MKTAPSASTSCAKRASSDGFRPEEYVHWHDTSSADSRLARIGSCYLHLHGADMRRVAVKFAAGFRLWIIPALALILAAIPAGAQKKDKNKNASASEAGGELKPGMYLPDSQAVDLAIGEALGYWQIGDADSLHKYY